MDKTTEIKVILLADCRFYDLREDVRILTMASVFTEMCKHAFAIGHSEQLFFLPLYNVQD